MIDHLNFSGLREPHVPGIYCCIILHVVHTVHVLVVVYNRTICGKKYRCILHSFTGINRCCTCTHVPRVYLVPTNVHVAKSREVMLFFCYCVIVIFYHRMVFITNAICIAFGTPRSLIFCHWILQHSSQIVVLIFSFSFSFRCFVCVFFFLWICTLGIVF